MLLHVYVKMMKKTKTNMNEAKTVALESAPVRVAPPCSIIVPGPDTPAAPEGLTDCVAPGVREVLHTTGVVRVVNLPEGSGDTMCVYLAVAGAVTVTTEPLSSDVLNVVSANEVSVTV